MKSSFKFAILFFPTLCYSYTFLGTMPPGDPIRCNSARTSAMGNIVASCIVDEPNIYYLPASVMYVKNKQLTLTLNYLPVEEEWIRKDRPSLRNLQNYTFASFIAVLPFKNFSFGFGITPLRDMQYKNREDIYVASTLEISSQTTNTGTLYAYTISAAYRIRNFTLGLGINLLRAEYQKIVELYNYQTRIYTRSKHKGKLEGLNISISSVIELSKKFLLGLSYVPKTNLDKDHNINLPSQFTISSTLDLENATVAFEVISSENKKPELHFGVEHFLNFPIRYGFSFIPHPNDDRHYSFVLSCGSGVKISKNTILDFAISYETFNNKISESTYIQQNSYKLTCSTKFIY